MEAFGQLGERNRRGLETAMPDSLGGLAKVKINLVKIQQEKYQNRSQSLEL